MEFGAQVERLRRTAILYRLVSKCSRHQVDPFDFLKDIQERLQTHPAERCADLWPDNWFASHPQNRRTVAPHRMGFMRWFAHLPGVAEFERISLADASAWLRVEIRGSEADPEGSENKT